MDLSFRDRPITSFEDLKAALTDLFNSHPYLSALLHHPDGIQEQVDLWPIMDGIKSYGDTPPLRELDDDIENVLGQLVSYNNNWMNFGPNGAPDKVNYRLAYMLVNCILNAQGLVRLELCPSLTEQTLVALDQISLTKWCVQEWTWRKGETVYDLGGISDSEPFPSQRQVSTHRTHAAADKAFNKLVKTYADMKESK
jgi:hypothetical protein